MVAPKSGAELQDGQRVLVWMSKLYGQPSTSRRVRVGPMLGRYERRDGVWQEATLCLSTTYASGKVRRKPLVYVAIPGVFCRCPGHRERPRQTVRRIYHLQALQVEPFDFHAPAPAFDVQCEAEPRQPSRGGSTP